MLKALTECSTKQEIDGEVVERLALVKGILSRQDNPTKDFWEHFLGELEKPDYATFKKSLFSPR